LPLLLRRIALFVPSHTMLADAAASFAIGAEPDHAF
jgi:hypothetical protein